MREYDLCKLQDKNCIESVRYLRKELKTALEISQFLK